MVQIHILNINMEASQKSLVVQRLLICRNPGGLAPSPLPSPRPSLSDIFRYFQLPPLLSPIKDPLLLESPESRPRKTRKDPGHEDSEKHPSLQVQFPLKKLKMTSYLRSTYLKNSVDVFVQLFLIFVVNINNVLSFNILSCFNVLMTLSKFSIPSVHQLILL